MCIRDRSDTAESGLPAPGADNDGDGIADNIAPNSFADTDGIVSDTSTDLGNQTGDTTEVAFREVGARAVELTKQIINVAPAASGTSGNFDVTYVFVLENTGDVTLDNLRLTDDFASQFGGGFVGIVGTPTIAAGPGAVVPGANPAFDGGITNANIFNGTSGEIEVGEFIDVTLVVEVDPDSPTVVLNANDQLLNQATGGGDDDSGNSVDDFSDDPTDATDNDLNGDGNADDPTIVSFSAVNLIKSAGATSAAASGVSGNFDVTYTFLVENTGTVDLNNLVLNDDLAGQLGGAFVGVVTNVAVTNIDATTAPGGNPTFAGTATENLLDGTGLLEAGQSFEVTVTVEVDADADPSVLDSAGAFRNSATITGDDPDGNPVDDVSDDPTVATDVDPNADNNPDDPTIVFFADIDVEKETGAIIPAASGISGNFTVEYVFTVTNTGSDVLNSLTLTDDFASQFGGNFVAVVPGSVVVTNVDAATVPGANAAFAGGPADNILDGTGSFGPGESFTVSVLVEVDPDADPAALVNGSLENSATVTGVKPNGVIVSDVSDDPNIATDVDPDGDNNPDDPTLVSFSAIDLTKAATSIGPASSGTAGNVDVEYTFTVTNDGSLDLTNLVLVDDFAGQLGGNFVAAVPGSVTVTNIDATTAPGANAAFSGAPGENLLDGTGLLQSGQSYTVTVVIEVDPDADPAALVNGGLENSATTSGDTPDGTTVTDVSDDPTVATDVDPNNDGNPDDPTTIFFRRSV